MSYDRQLHLSDLARLDAFYEYFANTDNEFYRTVNGWPVPAAQTAQFMQTVDDTGFLVVFDWGEWTKQHDRIKDLNANMDDFIMCADLLTLRRLLTAYTRGDRFTEGTYRRAIETGKIARVLHRLRDIRTSSSCSEGTHGS